MAPSSVTVKSYRKEREAEIISNLEKGLGRAGLIVARQAKKNVTSPLPSGKTHSPTERQDTNRLANSIGDETTGGIFRHESSGNEMSVVVGTRVPYGLYLEMGTSKMPPYPWLFPAVELKKPEIIDALKSAGGNLVDTEVVGGIWEE